MRSRVLLSATLLLLLVAFAPRVYAQGTTASTTSTASTDSKGSEEPSYFTLSGGWSWPVGGPVQDTYESGLTLGASFRTGVADNYLSGIEFAYGWYSLDSANLASLNPGTTYSGGDMGLLSITTENDLLYGSPAKPARPFLNLGLGYYKSFIDDATQTTGGTTTAYSTGVYKGSFFGFHAGIGAIIHKERFGIRLDANYQHLFAGGPDLEYFTARGGIVFYLD
jgi:hypothetical protein